MSDTLFLIGVVLLVVSLFGGAFVLLAVAL